MSRCTTCRRCASSSPRIACRSSGSASPAGRRPPGEQLDVVAQVLALDELHHEVVHAQLEADVVHHHHVRAVELADRARLDLEALQHARVGHHLGRMIFTATSRSSLRWRAL
jgi:hypothetical protein